MGRERERRDDRVHARAVGQTRVDHRARLVDPPPGPGDDPVDHLEQVALGAEPHLRLLDQPAPLDVDRVMIVHHHLGDLRVGQERLDRPVAEDVVRDLADEPHAVGRAERRARLGQRLVDGLGDLLVEILLTDVALREGLAQLVDGLGLGGLPDLCERVILLRAGVRCGGHGLGSPHATGERAPARSGVTGGSRQPRGATARSPGASGRPGTWGCRRPRAGRG